MSDYYTNWVECVKQVHIGPFAQGQIVWVKPGEQVNFTSWCEVVKWRLRFAVGPPLPPRLLVEWQEEAVPPPSFVPMGWKLLAYPPLVHYEETYLQPGGPNWPLLDYSFEEGSVYDSPEMVGVIDENGHYTAPAQIDPSWCFLGHTGQTPQAGVPKTGLYCVLVYAVPLLCGRPQAWYPKGPNYQVGYDNRVIAFEPWVP